VLPLQARRSVGAHFYALVAAKRRKPSMVQADAGARRHRGKTREELRERVAPVGRQSHDFSLVSVFAIADELTNHRVDGAEGVRNVDAVSDPNRRAFALAEHAGHEVAGSVDREAGRTIPA